MDGVGAFDHVKRAAFFAELLKQPALRPLLPLVRTFYGSQSRVIWSDGEGVQHVVGDGEGG